ncbi:hypothetical protein B0O80DRAFT_453031 [Mortierella sp. GBAus27b]|nr:hypothetical protein BGX31_006230 [Mortierella sp. GBA43]KAI8353070.1 hypothetical protein B0O80DRAFT_453031 [Mortierella sp. GBAus27b]
MGASTDTWNSSLARDIQGYVGNNNASELSRALVSCTMISSGRPEDIDRLRGIIALSLQPLQDPVSLVIDTLISISTVADSSNDDRRVEMDVTQFLVSVLKRFLDRWEQTTGAAGTRGAQAAEHRRRASNLLDDEDGTTTLGGIKPLQPTPLDRPMGLMGLHQSTQSRHSFSGRGYQGYGSRPSSPATEPDTLWSTEKSNSATSPPTDDESRYPIQRSHQLTVLREILLKRSTLQVFALLEIFDMGDLLDHKIPSQNQLSMNEETYGSQLAQQLLEMGQTTEAVILVSKILRTRTKDLDYRVLPFLVQLEDEELVDEFVGEHHAVCLNVLEAIEMRFQIHINAVQKLNGLEPRVRLAEIAMNLIMRFKLEQEAEMNLRFTSFMIRYTTCMSLLDELFTLWQDQDQRQSGSRNMTSRWPNKSSNVWRVLPAVESMIRGDQDLQKMVITYCHRQRRRTQREVYQRIIIYLSRKLKLGAELVEWVFEAEQDLEHQVQLNGDGKPTIVTKEKHASECVTKDVMKDVMKDVTKDVTKDKTKDETKEDLPSTSPATPLAEDIAARSPPPPPASASAPASAQTEPGSTNSTSTQSPIPAQGPVSASIRSPTSHSPPPQPFVCPIYTIAPTSKVVLINRLDQLGQVYPVLHRSTVVGMTTIGVPDTRHPSQRLSNGTQRRAFYNNNQVRDYPRALPLLDVIFKGEYSNHRGDGDGPEMTSLLQLACDPDECVYVVDVMAFMGDPDNRLPRLLGSLFSNKEIKKILFNWSYHRAVLESVFPILRLPQHQLHNFLDLKHVYCRFTDPPVRPEDMRQYGNGNTDMTEAYSGGWIRYTLVNWATRPQPKTIGLNYGGQALAIKKLCSKRLHPLMHQFINWTERPLANESVMQAATVADSLLSIYNALMKGTFIE